MTAFDRFERSIPELMTELAPVRAPDYVDDLLRRTAQTRQRPAWSALERWIPMADLTGRITTAPRVPWRQIATALVVIALLAVAAAVFVGSRTPRLPPPFGVASNGLVVYSSGGDIYTVDPVTGTRTAIVTGPEIDGFAEYSQDGSKLLFARSHDSGLQRFDLFVANADGSNPRLVSTEPVDLDAASSWTADGTTLLIGTAGGTVTRYDATGRGQPQVVVDGARIVSGALRPPGGTQLLYEPDGTPEADLWIMNLDGTGARRILVTSGGQADLSQYRWSPDGTMIAFACAGPTGPTFAVICVMNADGTGVRQLADEPGQWVETDLRWAPDGKRIAFNRWHAATGTQDWQIQPIGIASIDGGAVMAAGLAPGTDGALFDWSPDGTTLISLPARFAGSVDPTATATAPVLIDATTGMERAADWTVASDVSWQRRAMP
jgi:Tol biopolymer transport system component